MKPLLAALVAGLLFGLGIAVSGMGNPAKVMNFFDVAGTWDPSLAFVMGGALAVALPGYRIILRRPAPLFDTRFHLPTLRRIDARLIGGSALFGVGWGITGFCPGGAIPALAFAPLPTALFLVAMVAGLLLARAFPLRPQQAQIT